MEFPKILPHLFHFLLLDDKVLPVKHLNLGLVFTLFQLVKQLADFLKDTIFLYYDVVFFFCKLGRLLARLKYALLR